MPARRPGGVTTRTTAGGGVSLAQVEGRIRALVGALALASSSGRWPLNRLDEDVTSADELAAALADYRTLPQINALIGSELASPFPVMRDAETYDVAVGYAEATFVRRTVAGATASYVSIQAVPANDPTTSPGTGNRWEEFWDRAGYEDGPPNAFVGAALANSLLTFTREGGTNPQTLDLSGLEGNLANTRVEVLHFVNVPTTAFPGLRSWTPDIQTPAPTASEPNPEVLIGEGATPRLVRRTSSSVFTLAAGVYDFEMAFDITSTADRAVPELRILASADDALLAQSSGEYHRGTAAGIPDRLFARAYLTEDTACTLQFGSAGGSAGNSGAPGQAFAAANPELRITRIGSVENRVSVDARVELGRAVFDWDGTEGQVALTNTNGDTTQTARNAAIVCPQTGWITAVVTIDSLGFDGAVTEMLAADLRAERLGTETGLSLYTDATTGQIHADFGGTGTAQDDAEIIIFHSGTTADSSGIPSHRPSPQIERFSVTGARTVDAGSIAGDSYGFELAISQPAHVSLARIVGFVGTDASPSTVAVLHTVTDPTHETGSVAIPAGTSLTAGQIYTLRLEVYEEGQTAADDPIAYHDFRITARAAAAARVRFGATGFDYDADNIPTAATLVASIDFDDETIQQMDQAAGTWTVSGLTGGDTDAFVMWIATPAALTQPAHFTEGGIQQDSAWLPAVSRQISSDVYNVRITDPQAPGNAAALNGQQWVVT